MQFLYKYTEILDRNRITYDVLYWDRDMDDSITIRPFNGRGIVFRYKMSNYQPKYKKLSGFLKCMRFFCKTIREGQYDHLILLTTQTALPLYLLSSTVRKSEYIYDFRDLTYEKNKIGKKIIQQIINKSNFTALSSQGFKEVLGETSKFVMSHNVSNLIPEFVQKKSSDVIRVVYWGMIRQVEWNKKICDLFGNLQGMELTYHGEGHLEELKDYCIQKGYRNIKFTGRYTVDQIPEFVRNAEVLLNLYKNDAQQKLATTVKLYDGIRYGLPMMITKGSFMSDLMTDNPAVFCTDLDNFSIEVYHKWYKELPAHTFFYKKELEQIQRDDQYFEEKVISFVGGKSVLRIGIYIYNYDIADVDCSNLLEGNPGIGGTEYCILLLAQVYKKYYPNNEVVILASKMAIFPEVDEVVEVDGLDGLCNVVCKKGVDILVISAVYKGEPLPQVFFDTIEDKKIKTILWGHNYYLSDFCNQITRCSYIKANVFVGRQQFDRYVDHKVIKKSTYIYNIFPAQTDVVRKSIIDHSVTYVGSLVPTKGFHVLASVWKDILKAVPDATLNVIGSGKLYDRNSKLGKYNIADKEYENSFMPGLIDESGQILASVHFLGVLGAEKNEVIKDTCVGVVNPTGRTETFGISALDFESHGVPVVTIAKGGFLDTVIDGETGVLYGRASELAEKIIEMLENVELNWKYGEAGRVLAAQFSPHKIIKEWDRVFHCVMEDREVEFKKPNSFMKTDLKQLRCLNRFIKNTLRIEYPISVIGLETFARKMLRRFGR